MHRASTGRTGDGDDGGGPGRGLNQNQTLLLARIDVWRDPFGKPTRPGYCSLWARTGLPGARSLQGHRAPVADSARCAGPPCASSQGSATSSG